MKKIILATMMFFASFLLYSQEMSLETGNVLTVSENYPSVYIQFNDRNIISLNEEALIKVLYGLDRIKQG